jgi:rhodanese-related sulfurtransferase
MGFFSKLFGPSKSTLEAARLVGEGARLIDVRTHMEYEMGHIEGSENIPLDRIGQAYKRLQKGTQPLVLCCASGRRSGIAMRTLKDLGLREVYNGGGWRGLRAAIQEQAALCR